ncbi:hypothetical protein FRC01_004470 [Tulasnella sp. 417]|nr:hypothetical protein FRC01_004470 [Tulasnella sp. 417]
MPTPAPDAISFSLKKHSYEVSVKVDDRAIPIYKSKYFPAQRKLLGWIESETGQEYSIFMKQNTGFNYTTAADLYTDGRKVCDTVFGKDYGFQDELSGIAISSAASRPFSFRQLETTGHNHGFDTPGVIEVRMNRVRIVETGREDNWDEYSTQVPERELLVHESEHKAGTHVMQLGDEKPSDNVRIFTLPWEPSDENPWVTFEFHYRPAAVLQAEGIMPRPQNEPATPSKARRGNKTMSRRESVNGSQRSESVTSSQRSVRGVTRASRGKSARQIRSSTHSSVDGFGIEMEADGFDPEKEADRFDADREADGFDAESEAARKAKILVIEALQASVDAQVAEYREQYGNLGLPLRYAVTK